MVLIRKREKKEESRAAGFHAEESEKNMIRADQMT